MYYYYKHKNNVLFSPYEYRGFTSINESMAQNSSGTIFFLGRLPLAKSRMSFVISDSSLLYIKTEGIDLLNRSENKPFVSNWILEKIEQRKIIYINTEYPNWESVLDRAYPAKWNINIIALGDIGSSLLTGLKLLGKDHINKIGIYDKNLKNAERWEFELNQISPPFPYDTLPEVDIIDEDELMQCDMIILCTADEFDSHNSSLDIRMAQLKKNSEMITLYAQHARNKQFKGIFAIMSDPVDLLCKRAFTESNRDKNNHIDFRGLAPEQIRGYGLGIMNARALYYSKKYPKFKQYMHEGRAFGSNGSGLIIADSIENYNDILSDELTELALNANLEMNKLGYKSYIAPAISSGAHPIIATISQDWHYASTFIGGVFMGANNRLINGSCELERLDLPEKLFSKIQSSYKKLDIL